MLSYSGIAPTHVDLREIDLSNEEYRISRCPLDEQLIRSIKDFGVLEAPVLLRRDRGHLIVFGHNRLAALKLTGAEGCEAVMLDSVEPRGYIDYAILKIHRNELSALGRLKLMLILKNRLGCNEAFLKRFARLGTRAGDEAIAGGGMDACISALPRPLALFFDSRDINMKMILRVLGLPSGAITLLSGWVDAYAMRVNVFREIVELLDDIHRRDGTLAAVQGVAPDEARDGREYEQHIHEALYTIRYPRYSRLRAIADDVVRDIGRKGAEANLPPFFEGDEVGLRFVFRKDEDPREAEERLRRITAEDLKKLFDLL